MKPAVRLSLPSARATNQRKNLDGSTDVDFGQKAPAGKESNWMATPAGRCYFVIIRLYGPTEAAINKTWVPGDLEKMQ